MKRGAIEIINEFLKYFVVGGVSFIVDYLTLISFHEVIIPNIRYSLYISSIIGFLLGLITNYNMSIRYVFRSAFNNNKGRSSKDKLLFLSIGAIGLLFNEAGFFFGSYFLGISYRYLKIVIAFIVLIWNFIARKILIFT